MPEVTRSRGILMMEIGCPQRQEFISIVQYPCMSIQNLLDHTKNDSVKVNLSLEEIKEIGEIRGIGK